MPNMPKTYPLKCQSIPVVLLGGAKCIAPKMFIRHSAYVYYVSSFNNFFLHFACELENILYFCKIITAIIIMAIIISWL